MPDAYHPDFPASAANGLFHTQEGVHFSFDADLLGHFSPSIADLVIRFGPQTKFGREGSAIGISVNPEAFALSLTVIRHAVNHRLGSPKPKWPSTEILSDIIGFVDGDSHDNLVIGADPVAAFDRYAFACAIKSPCIKMELAATLPFHHSQMSKWAKTTLARTDPLGLANLYEAHLDKRDPPTHDDGRSSSKRKKVSETRESVIAAVLERR
ncbi:uncharacterized protein LOC62_04G006588 [Vanrija pseudolonga]|uniref:Uncharacterized protein n=1 Tax=Vanrija pseudolonga TaxID=143232 RepID=A0AAF0YAX0_9TREE|nr:hypothetical protein LOC62_04G006588 [Vanrija pseudolonga]